MRLLVADYDVLFLQKLQKILGKERIATDLVSTDRELIDAVRDHSFDLLILGLGSTADDTAIILRRLLAQSERLPVIVVSAYRKLQDRIKLLNAGADDSLAKPLPMQELLARIHALLRRTRASTPSKTITSVGPLRLYPHLLTATLDDQPVALTHREYRLLEVLIRKRDQVLSRTQLEDSLYAWGEKMGSNTVEVYVHQLRRKLRPEVIKTIRGVGYQLSPSLWN
jgi:DNA-binding response OmpR family regulator